MLEEDRHAALLRALRPPGRRRPGTAPRTPGTASGTGSCSPRSPGQMMKCAPTSAAKSTASSVRREGLVARVASSGEQSRPCRRAGRGAGRSRGSRCRGRRARPGRRRGCPARAPAGSGTRSRRSGRRGRRPRARPSRPSARLPSSRLVAARDEAGRHRPERPDSEARLHMRQTTESISGLLQPDGVTIPPMIQFHLDPAVRRRDVPPDRPAGEGGAPARHDRGRRPAADGARGRGGSRDQPEHGCEGVSRASSATASSSPARGAARSSPARSPRPRCGTTTSCAQSSSGGSTSARRAGLDEESIRALDLRNAPGAWPVGWHDAAPLDARGLGQALPPRVGAARLHADDSRAARSSGWPGRTLPASRRCSRSRRACSRRPRARSPCSGRDPLREPSVLAEVGYVAAGRAALPLVHRRRDDRVRAPDELALGRRDRRELLTRLDSRDEGRRAFGRRARPARARARARQAAAARCCSTSRSPGSTRSPGREFLQLLMDGVAETSADRRRSPRTSIADIERVCDHIVLLADGRVRLEGRRRGAARVAPDPDRPPPADRHDPRRPRDRAGAAQRPPADAARRSATGRSSTRRGRSSASASRSCCSPTWRPSGCRTPPPPERLPLQWHG